LDDFSASVLRWYDLVILFSTFYKSKVRLGVLSKSSRDRDRDREEIEIEMNAAE
jgi:hypothetical protein